MLSRRWIGCVLVLLLGGGLSLAEMAPMPAVMARVGTACAAAVVKAGLHQVGVMEFADGQTHAWGGEIGAAGRLLAMQLDAAVRSSAAKKYATADSASLIAALHASGITPDTISTPAAIAALRKAAPGLDGLIYGTLTRRSTYGDFAVKLLAFSTGKTVAATVDTLPLDFDLLALCGINLRLPTHAARVQLTAATAAAALRMAADKPAPQLDPGCPYRLEVLVENQTLSLYRNGKALFVAAKQGQVYRMRLMNNSNDRVGVALLLDGLTATDGQRLLPATAPKLVIAAHSGLDVYGRLLDKGEKQAFAFDLGPNAVHPGLITAVFFPEAPAPVSKGVILKELADDPIPTGAIDTPNKRVWTLPSPTGGSVGEKSLELDDFAPRTVAHAEDAPLTPAINPAAILTLRYADAAVVEKYSKP